MRFLRDLDESWRNEKRITARNGGNYARSRRPFRKIIKLSRDKDIAKRLSFLIVRVIGEMCRQARARTCFETRH